MHRIFENIINGKYDRDITLVTAVEAFGDITANSLIFGEPVEGERFMKRAQGGILADGFNSLLAAAIIDSLDNCEIKLRD